MELYKKSTKSSYIEVYLLLPTLVFGRKTESLVGGHNKTTNINVNLFNFNLINNPVYVILEIGFIIGLGIKIIDKENK